MKDTHITTSMTMISSDGTTPLHEVPAPQKQVSVKIQYPKSFEGDKYFPNGHVEHGMAIDSAEKLVKAGIGTIIEEEIPEEATGKPYSKMNKADLSAELVAREIEFDESAVKAELIRLLEEDDDAKN